MKDADRMNGPAVVVTLASDPAYFDDDRFGVCHFCAGAVRYRPHVPIGSTLVCRCCFLARVEPGDRIAVSAQAVREFQLFRSRN